MTFERNGRTSYGIWRQDGVVDLGQVVSSRFATLAGLIAGDGLDDARAHGDDPACIGHDAVRLLKPRA